MSYQTELDKNKEARATMCCPEGHTFAESEALCLGIQRGIESMLLLFNCPQCNTTLSRPLTEDEMRTPMVQLADKLKGELRGEQ